jgi:IS30 family transposase
VTMVERKSLYTIIDAVARKTAAAVRRVIVAGLTPHRGRVYTLTYDNGKELTEHEQIAKELGTKIYFAHPYSSWERGLNENTRWTDSITDRERPLDSEPRSKYSSPRRHP